MSHLLCLGLGYSAAALAHRLGAQGFRISGTSRSAEGVSRLAQAGWNGCVFSGEAPSAALAHAIATATHVLVSIPPDAAGDPALRHHAGELAAAPTLCWIGYLSTVGVYGDHGGGWVDETTLPAPRSERGRRRLAAEREWLALGERSGKRVQVFRLPGIYGPGRSAIDAVRSGTARRIVKPGQVFNRIHVDDIARALAAAMQVVDAPPVLNLVDDAPSPPEEVVAYAAELLGLAPPPAIAFGAAELSPMARSFYGESKRVSNARMKSALGIALAYPSYREGLAAIATQSG